MVCVSHSGEFTACIPSNRLGNVSTLSRWCKACKAEIFRAIQRPLLIVFGTIVLLLLALRDRVLIKHILQRNLNPRASYLLLHAQAIPKRDRIFVHLSHVSISFLIPVKLWPNRQRPWNQFYWIHHPPTILQLLLEPPPMRTEMPPKVVLRVDTA